MWFDRTARFELQDDEQQLEVAVPNQFVADWIGRYYGDVIQRVAASEVGSRVAMKVRIKPEDFGEHPQPAATGTAAAPAQLRSPAPTIPPATRPSAYKPTSRRYRLDEFVVGPSNELAFAAANRLVEDERAGMNPLFIHGGCGLGKTHLLRGVCHRMRQLNPGARVLYLTAEQFTNQFLAAIQGNRLADFRHHVRQLDLLAIDDIQFFANKSATQREFLHCFDSIDMGGAKLVLASDRHPRQVRQFSEPLVSRCLRGMVVHIGEPDTATRARIVQAIAERRGIPMLDTVIEVIAARCAGSVREIEGTITKLEALARLSEQSTQRRMLSDSDQPDHHTAGAVIGHTLVERLFQGEPTQQPRKPVTVDRIVEHVAQAFAVSTGQILSSSRHQHLVAARSIAIVLIRDLTTMSYPEIAREMNRKSHSTIITACQRVEKQLKAGKTVTLPEHSAAPLQQVIEDLKRQITRG